MELTPIIGQIYDCIDDAEQWPAVLESLYDAFDCSTASFQTASVITGELCFSSPLGFDQSWIDEYQRDWHSKNPLIDAVLDFVLSLPAAERGVACPLEDSLGRSAYHQSLIYREFFRESDLADHIQLPINVRSDPIGISLTAGHRRGVFTEDQIKAARIITPHMVRAGNISDKLRYAKAFSAVENLKVFSEPSFIIDQRGAPLDGNDAAKDLLGQESILIDNGVRLVFRNSKVDQGFQQHMHEMNTLESSTGSLHRVADLEVSAYTNAVLYALPLCPFNRLAAPKRREYLMCVSQQAKLGETVIQGLTERFELTKSERAIAALMLEGLSVSDISGRRNTKISTTRWHVKRLFEKLSVSSQRELIRKLLLQ